jgi:hypothetical protein
MRAATFASRRKRASSSWIVAAVTASLARITLIATGRSRAGSTPR